MLKALEIFGFKSFADKTRLEFPSGITVVVGPNGSGKSNIVDAIKWVLGEQRVKSLRGTEMADVIFNGSGTRRPMNSAEITLTLNNAGGLLPVDTPEVHITRRVYRSGEGEYLINRQPCRLRDVRDLLAGTGLGTQAYSVIEQGKVDVLLQSSARERRVIFEEAAGISRFKAKKIEAERRLERVEQNLLRLSDIVDEVESRLRSIRVQAGKARRYRTYTNRLQELRTQVGLVDWTRLSGRLAVFEAELESLSDQRGRAIVESEVVEAGLLEAETLGGDVTEQIRQVELRMAANRERIAAQESSIDHQRTRCRDLDAEIARHRQQLASMGVRAGDLQEQLHRTSREVDEAVDHHGQIARLVAEGERALAEVIEELDRFRGEHEQRRRAHVDQLRAAAALSGEISRLEGEVSAAQTAGGRCDSRAADLQQQLERLAAELETLCREKGRLGEEVKQQGEQLAAAQDQLAQRQDELGRRRNELAELRRRRSVAAERLSLLDDLQRRQEGVGSAVKEVLALAALDAPGAWRHVCGLVADAIRVDVEAAPLVEIALGDAAQHLIADGNGELLDQIKQHGSRMSGRVGFVWLDDATANRDAEPSPDLADRPGVVERADRLVECEPECRALVRRLLDRTWVVETLDLALELKRTTGGSIRYVTLAGEMLAADGTLTVGTQQTATGLISRQSELRALAVAIDDLDRTLGESQAAVAALEGKIRDDRGRAGEIARQHAAAGEALASLEIKITTAEERKSQFTQQQGELEAESRRLASLAEAAALSLDETRRRKEDVDRDLAELESRVAALGHEIEAREAEHQTRNRETTGAKVELAKSAGRLENLRAQLHQLEEGREERHRAIAENRQQLADCGRRAEQARWAILGAESEVAELYLSKEAFAAQTVELFNQRETIRRRRAEATERSGKIRIELRHLDEKINAQQLAAGEIRHQRASLADRLREDYGIELSELEHEPTSEEQHQREEVQQEIDELRRKINNLGNVNLEALEELDQLESRHAAMAEQYGDLEKSKNALARIIERINTDSRRLFAETLETVKGHFQTLFRDLFGGGQADIVLEEGTDILETGIEIVARPPGKEPRSISLLSGGEKTLTCVALLLAIFRSRPSPFCVLDEVDAALDEANIDRFTKVLGDFLAWTQFIIVTHSKKTMTCGNTIYGVTMQESGVSKQVSVHFEDVSETGEILTPPGRPAANDEIQAA